MYYLSACKYFCGIYFVVNRVSVPVVESVGAAAAKGPEPEGRGYGGYGGGHVVSE